MNEQLITNYKDFLNNGKTERECVKQLTRLAEEHGYRDISSYTALKPGDKVYVQKMNKTIAFFEIGAGSAEDGMKRILSPI